MKAIFQERVYEINILLYRGPLTPEVCWATVFYRSGILHQLKSDTEKGIMPFRAWNPQANAKGKSYQRETKIT